MPKKSLVFDPRMLITGPFYPCSRCEQPQLGSLSITDNVHTRRCRNCFHTEREHLPPLQKKLIYLDQMVLSGIAKELDPDQQEETRGRDDFWLEAFDQIDRLKKLQLIVCPESPIHERESSLDDRYEPVWRRLYEHLASGVGLRSHDQVLMTQLSVAFDAWFTHRDPDWNRISREDVTRGRLDRWDARMRIAVNLGHWSGRIERRRDARDRAHATLEQLWEQWASEGQVPFDDRFKEQLHVVGDAALQAYVSYLQRLRRMATGEEELVDPLELTPGWPVQLVMWLLGRLEEEGVPQQARLTEAARFLRSEPALCAPQNHLESLLYAGLARRAALGQKCVGRGTPNDIRLISAYLPYCDAMFIDDEFAQLLSEPPVAPKVNYPTRIYSKRTRRDFLSYLAALEAEADQDHVDLVFRTYGETWTVPYRSMLEHERNRRATTR